VNRAALGWNAPYSSESNPIVQEISMKQKMVYVLALATIMLAYGFGVEVRQSPPQPDCAGFPELCVAK